jgi:hypothetical protein
VVFWQGIEIYFFLFSRFINTNITSCSFFETKKSLKSIVIYFYKQWHLDRGGEDSPRGGSPGGPEAGDVAGSEARDEGGTGDAD